MADIPRDPRQLARDILAGRVSLEDLAREQARRRGQAAQPGQPAPAPPPQQPRPRPPVEADRLPAPLTVNRTPAPPRQPARGYPRPQQQQQRRSPVFTPPPSRPVVTPPAQPIGSPIPEELAAPPSPAPVQPTRQQPQPKKFGRKPGIKALLNSKAAARHAFLMAEILNKPLSLRD